MRRAAAYLKEGMTEEGAAYILEQYRALGCEGPSFPPHRLFRGQRRRPPPHARRHPPAAGDCIVLDIGGKKGGYCSDMTRTYFCKQADPRHAALHDLVRRANEAAEALVRPGVRLCDLDKAARDLIADAGYGAYFTHRLGISSAAPTTSRAT